jgi:hypothetical protein
LSPSANNILNNPVCEEIIRNKQDEQLSINLDTDYYNP